MLHNHAYWTDIKGVRDRPRDIHEEYPLPSQDIDQVFFMALYICDALMKENKKITEREIYVSYTQNPIA